MLEELGETAERVAMLEQALLDDPRERATASALASGLEALGRSSNSVRGKDDDPPGTGKAAGTRRPVRSGGKMQRFTTKGVPIKKIGG